MSSGSFFGRCWSRARIQADVRVNIHQLKISFLSRLHHSSHKNEVKNNYWGHKVLIFELLVKGERIEINQMTLKMSHLKWPEMTQDNKNLIFSTDNKGVFEVKSS